VCAVLLTQGINEQQTMADTYVSFFQSIYNPNQGLHFFKLELTLFIYLNTSDFTLFI